MDYGKFKYEKTKKEKENKKKQKNVVIKEIRIKPHIDEHDKETKISQIKKFIEKEYKVKISLRLSGREKLRLEDVGSPELCRLGKWYHASDNPFKGLPEYQALDHPHRLVHEMAAQAAAFYENGDIKNAKRSFRLLRRSSGKVIHLLNRLIHRIERGK